MMTRNLLLGKFRVESHRSFFSTPPVGAAWRCWWEMMTRNLLLGKLGPCGASVSCPPTSNLNQIAVIFDSNWARSERLRAVDTV